MGKPVLVLISEKDKHIVKDIKPFKFTFDHAIGICPGRAIVLDNKSDKVYHYDLLELLKVLDEIKVKRKRFFFF